MTGSGGAAKYVMTSEDGVLRPELVTWLELVLLSCGADELSVGLFACSTICCSSFRTRHSILFAASFARLNGMHHNARNSC